MTLRIYDDALEMVKAEQISWEEFPDYAQRVLEVLGGEIASRADSPVERVWSVTIGGQACWLSFNDFALGVSLDSCDALASAALPEMGVTLERHRNTETPE